MQAGAGLGEYGAPVESSNCTVALLIHSSGLPLNTLVCAIVCVPILKKELGVGPPGE